MRSLISLIAIAFSFVPLAVAGPFGPTTRSSRVARNPISSRQFQHSRALVDVCANIDLSLKFEDVPGADPGNLNDICLCLSAFPLDLGLYTDLQGLTSLLGGTGLDTLLQSFVNELGTQCTYPDNASPVCTSANPCGFTCADGFTLVGGACVCPPPSTVCNGKCGSYGNGCTSPLPGAPKRGRRSISSYNRRGSNGIDGPISGGKRSSGSDASSPVGVSVSLNGALSGIDGLVNSILGLVNQILSSIFGPGVTTKLTSNPTSSPKADTPGQADVVIDIDLSGILGPNLSSKIDQLLAQVSNALTGLLRTLGLDLDISLVVHVNGGPSLERSMKVNVKG